MNEKKDFIVLADPTETGDEAVNAALLKKCCQTCGYPRAQGGDICDECEEKAKAARRQYHEMIRGFNEFFYGCPNPVHSSKHGTFDPNDRDFLHLMDG